MRVMVAGASGVLNRCGSAPHGRSSPVVEALVELERQTRDAGGLVLRMGHLYGRGTIYAPDGFFVQQVRSGAVPLVRGGSAVFSFIHVEDAAAAMVAALEHDVVGVLNVVDDAPTPITDWLPALAALLGARQPRYLPKAVVRLAVGGWGLAFLSRLRGANNARARESLNWLPQYSSSRQGFEHDLGPHSLATSGARARQATYT